ncbi:hypothetical protein CG419_03730 [Latilactobacillus curvatus]|uniref:DZANK-type domain-containing protein n=1 Tax=Latilactobacillus curvatus TaxID=28038 RepID=A0AAC9UNF1_LATCU|nr:hypothetical protein CG419_03730 [Latilactobacillus curvatus]
MDVHHEENTILKKCLRCGTLCSPQKGKNEYCMRCGAPIINMCTNLQCENSENFLPVDAVYCPLCGNDTVFHQFSLVSSPNEISDDDLPF